MRIRRYLATLPLLAACACVVPGCSSEGDSKDDLPTQLSRDTGVTWTVLVDPRSQEVRFLAPSAPVSIGNGSPDDSARAFFARYRDALHASGSSDELRPVSTTVDKRGFRHLRYEHLVPGTNLRVFDAGTTAHFAASGEVTWLETDFHADLANVPRTAAIARDAAGHTAVATTNATCAASNAAIATGELGVLAREEGKPTLAYRFTLNVTSAECTAPTVFVDATTGATLELEERAHGALGLAPGSHAAIPGEGGDPKSISVSPDPNSATTRYLMITDSADTGNRLKVRTSDITSSTVFASPNTLDWDTRASAKGAAVDAHYHAMKALEYYGGLTNPLQGDGPPLSRDLNAYVHWNNNISSGANARGYFDESSNRDIVLFGDGNPALIKNGLPYSAGFDIVAHEVAHLITDHTSKLVYANESGALNESFSDVMGASAEHWLAPNDKNNFVIGERIYVTKHAPDERTALRDMANPGSYGQPEHLRGAKRCAPNEAPRPGIQDFCYVHTNSGIPNRAFSLMVAGGAVTDSTNTTLGVPHGIGWDDATELWYWSISGLSSQASFDNAAHVQAAEALVRFGPDAAAAVRCAWYAVGVYQLWTDLERQTVLAQCSAPNPAPSPAPAPSPPFPDVPDVCAGHGDATICDPAVPASAVLCKGDTSSGLFLARTPRSVACRPARPIPRRSPTSTPAPSTANDAPRGPGHLGIHGTRWPWHRLGAP